MTERKRDEGLAMGFGGAFFVLKHGQARVEKEDKTFEYVEDKSQMGRVSVMCGKLWKDESYLRLLKFKDWLEKNLPMIQHYAQMEVAELEKLRKLAGSPKA